jgi:hypothetical protein
MYNRFDEVDAVHRELSIGGLMEAKFWGTIEIQFKNGVPVLIKKTETKTLTGTNPNANDCKKR